MKYLILIILVLLALSYSVNCSISINNRGQEVSGVDRVSDQVTCSICNFIVQETEKYIKKGVNDTQIISILDNDCERFGDYETTCENIVSWYTPTIIYLLEKGQPIQNVCYDIRQC